MQETWGDYAERLRVTRQAERDGLLERVQSWGLDSVVMPVDANAQAWLAERLGPPRTVWMYRWGSDPANPKDWIAEACEDCGDLIIKAGSNISHEQLIAQLRWLANDLETGDFWKGSKEAYALAAAMPIDLSGLPS